jgi:peptidoglycan/xylan/chitin deacetylase (PgdA/CDA1 family)
MYHDCAPCESDSTRGLRIHTTPDQLAAHLDFLSRHYQVIDPSSLSGTSHGRPSVLITFDDGFRSVFEHAWPMLRERGWLFIVYLTTDVIGNRTLLWLNEVNWFMYRHAKISRPMIAAYLGVSPSTHPAALAAALVDHYDRDRIAGLLLNLRAATGTETAALAHESRLHLGWEEIAEMAKAGVFFGNHTASHPPLVCLSQDGCRDEIGRAALMLAPLPGASANLAYPFGSHDEATKALALEMGYSLLMDVQGVNRPFDPTRIGRIKVSAHSAAELFALMEVVEPVKAALKRWLNQLRFRSRPGGA